VAIPGELSTFLPKSPLQQIEYVDRKYKKSNRHTKVYIFLLIYFTQINIHLKCPGGWLDGRTDRQTDDTQ